ncbi:MAG: THUMP domain-containing protein [Thermoplasmatales archaeon]|nr:THUMP domain-containing protein [Thermoplasmatales archaeon]MCW6170247.1 THUMP domain-containing protein [Thermoplasmatales archaeon]
MYTLVRYSEIGLKGDYARKRMENLLKRNIAKSLESNGCGASIHSERGRIFVESDGPENKVNFSLSHTFGVKSYSHVNRFEFTNLEDLTGKVSSTYSSIVNGKKFAIRARCVGIHTFGSRELSIKAGEELFPFSSGVDLEKPDVEIYIEVRDGVAYTFTEIIPGPGGLPLGSESRMVALVSGGIDSPVASWFMMKRGSPVDFVFLALAHPVDTVDFLRTIKSLVKEWSYGTDPLIHIVDGTKVVTELAYGTNYRVPGLTYKRILYRIAESIAKEVGAKGIVTGESLGQVSSQTPDNLLSINATIDFPIYRPLIGFDKDETTSLARKIGTYVEDTHGEFCALFSSKPVTTSKPTDINGDMDRFGDLSAVINSEKIYRASQIDDLLTLFKTEEFNIPEPRPDSIIVDLRSMEQFKGWHFPGSFNVPADKIGDFIQEHGQNRNYVFYCQKGLQSAFIASKLRSEGFNSNYIAINKLMKTQDVKHAEQKLG